MKKIIYFISTLFLLVSCNEWLDIQPDAAVSEKELFSTEEGFYEALNGVYTRCVQSDFYGGEFSLGFTEAMAQNYTNSVHDYTGYTKTSLFDFTDPYFKNWRDASWSVAYKAIANCNLILNNIDENKDLFSEGNYELIKGEALALRAFFHFDMLRFFAPSFLTDPSGEAIPYVSTYSNTVTPLSTVDETIELILADLNEAKELLDGIDPILNSSYVVGFPDGENSTEELASNLFLQNRRHRLNYYAVCGELARVYLYKNDYSNALTNALEVINSDKFPWVKPDEMLESDITQRDRIMYNELVFCWYGESQEQALENRFNSVTTGQYIAYDPARSIFEVASIGAEDYRFKTWFTQSSNSTGPQYQIQKYAHDEDVNKHYLVIPGIRLSEMYYIAAECTYQNNPSQAWEYFNTVRFHRGIGVTLDESSEADFTSEIIKEYRKETFAEGQFYFTCKRLNQDITSQTNVIFPASPSIYVVPLPESEIEFSNR